MSATLNRVQVDHDLKDVLDGFKKSIFINMNCHAIGTIQTFDPSTQTCTASMNYKKTELQKQPNGQYAPVLLDYPLLVDCPVFVNKGGPASLTLPIASGDTCIILFNDRDMDVWLSSGQIAAPATTRFHSFADAIMLVGISSVNMPIANYDPVNAVLQNGANLISVGQSILLQNGTTLISVDMAKIKIANSSTTLNTLLQNLITILVGLQTTPTIPGSPATLDPAVIMQLNMLGMQIGGLLE